MGAGQLDFYDLLYVPASWGVAGAFIYAAPRWAACLVTKRGAGFRGSLDCTIEFLVALVSGGIAAAAFSSTLLGMTELKEINAVSTMIGLLANPTTPVLVKRVSAIVGSSLSSKVEDKMPGD